MKWVQVAVPPVAEALAHRFALACEQGGVEWASITVHDGRLTGICMQEDGESAMRALHLFDGQWCELVDLEAGDGD